STVKDFPSRPVVVQLDSYPGFRRLLAQKFEALRMNFKPIFESDNVGTLKRVIEAGVGWGFMPAHSIRKQVRTRRLSHVHVDEIKYSVNVYLYCLKVQGLKAMSDTVFRAIQQQLLN